MSDALAGAMFFAILAVLGLFAAVGMWLEGDDADTDSREFDDWNLR
jgi:hypothetical protein